MDWSRNPHMWFYKLSLNVNIPQAFLSINKLHSHFSIIKNIFFKSLKIKHRLHFGKVQDRNKQAFIWRSAEKMNNWLLRAISVSMMVVSILATSRSTQRSTRKRSYKRGQSPSDAYERYVKRYNTYKRMYYEQFNPEKVKGRCAYSKNWKINGTNPIYEKSRFGYITILYLINTKCRYCVNELKSLHIWAEYFK